MSATNPSSTTGRQVDDRYDVSKLKDVMDETVSGQVLQRLDRIERTLSSMEERFGARLDAVGSRLEEIEARLSGQRGSGKRVVTEKPNIRNWLVVQLAKGWISEPEIMEKTGWQTIGVRSFITKQKSNGLAIDTEERDGTPYHRLAK